MAKSGLVLILTDAVFTFFLVHLSNRTGITVVSELSLTAVLPINHNSYVLIGICLMTIVFGAVSDSSCYVGRPGVILIGIFSCFMSGVFLLIGNGVSFLALVLFVYFASSPVRNVFLLEQKDRSQFDEVKKFVFHLSYTRLWVRILSVLLVEKGFVQMFHVYLTASSLVFFILYHLTFTTFLKGLYYEPTYKSINFMVLACFANACNSRKNPVYYRKDEIVVGILEVKKRDRVQFKDKQKVRKCLYGFFRAIVPDANAYVIREKHYMVRIQHWLLRSRPKSSEYVILQTLQFYRILSAVVLTSLFSHISNMILLFTMLQSDMVKKTSMDVLERFDVYSYFLLFQLVFFPIVEMLRPSLSKWLKKDFYLFFLGYGFLLLSCSVMVVLQAVIVPSLPYTPSSFTSQVRLFNANNQTIYVATFNEKEEHFIQSYDYKVFSDIPYDLKGQGWIKCNDKRLAVNFHLERTMTVSHVLKKCVLSKRNSTDPNIFKSTNNRFHAIFYLVTAEDLRGMLVLKSMVTPYTVGVNVSTDFDSFFMTPGTYNVTFQPYNEAKKKMFLANSRFVEGALYSVFIYREDQELKGKIVEVEGPLKYRYIHLLPQVVLLALGHAFATVSLFRVLYLESPEKLTATVFCTVLTVELLIYALSDSILPFYAHRYPYIITILGGVHLAIFIVGVAFASNLSKNYST